MSGVRMYVHVYEYGREERTGKKIKSKKEKKKRMKENIE